MFFILLKLKLLKLLGDENLIPRRVSQDWLSENSTLTFFRTSSGVFTLRKQKGLVFQRCKSSRRPLTKENASASSQFRPNF